MWSGRAAVSSVLCGEASTDIFSPSGRTGSKLINPTPLLHDRLPHRAATSELWCLSAASQRLAVDEAGYPAGSSFTSTSRGEGRDGTSAW